MAGDGGLAVMTKLPRKHGRPQSPLRLVRLERLWYEAKTAYAHGDYLRAKLALAILTRRDPDRHTDAARYIKNIERLERRLKIRPEVIPVRPRHLDNIGSEAWERNRWNDWESTLANRMEPVEEYDLDSPSEGRWRGLFVGIKGAAG